MATEPLPCRLPELPLPFRHVSLQLEDGSHLTSDEMYRKELVWKSLVVAYIIADSVCHKKEKPDERKNNSH